uniref:Gag-pol polyprotein n=1 Tax=Rosa rugosa TaxID=74645 RepID=J7G2X9_ROSRU|nr:gag-pol polyprotein [Rosa rugosa]
MWWHCFSDMNMGANLSILTTLLLKNKGGSLCIWVFNFSISLLRGEHAMKEKRKNMTTWFSISSYGNIADKEESRKQLHLERQYPIEMDPGEEENLGEVINIPLRWIRVKKKILERPCCLRWKWQASASAPRGPTPTKLKFVKQLVSLSRNDCQDYSQWKIMMRAFLYSQDENMWNIVEIGWEHPTMAEDSKKEEVVSARIPKPRKEWTKEEVRDRNCDFKARNSLFTALSKKERMRISHCDTAKQAWDLLQVTYEGNKKVRGQKLQRLVLEFENMSMTEDESIDDFHARLLNVTSQCRSLDDPFEEHRIVKKFLRSLPSKFQAKQIAIEEAQDLDTYTLDELVGNLKTFEMRLKPDKKVKDVAFSSINDKDDIVDDSMDLILLTKEFKKFLNDKNSFGNTSRNFSDTKRGQEFENRFDKNSKFAKFAQKKSFPDKPKCYECGGIGHIAANCGNRRYNSRGDKALKSTWSDSDEGSQSDSEEGEVKSQDWDKEHDDLINKIKILQDELSKVKESFNKFSIGSEKVSRMIGFGKAHSNKEGLGYEGESCKPLTFVKSLDCENSLGQSQTLNDNDSDPKLPRRSKPNLDFQTHQRVAQPRYVHNSKRFIPTCHHCGKIGHIRPRCNLLRRESQKCRKQKELSSTASLQAELKEHLKLINRIAVRIAIPKEQNLKQKQIWIKKGSNNCLSAHMDKLDNMFELASVPIKHKVADSVTKSLDTARFESLRSDIGGCSKY